MIVLDLLAILFSLATLICLYFVCWKMNKTYTKNPQKKDSDK